jgi:integrase
MPKRREGPIRNKQTGYYFFDEYVGFKPDKKRIRVSLRTKNPARAQWLWEQEYRKQWSKYYGIERPERPQDTRLSDIKREFIAYERDIKKVKEWKTIENRLRIVSECWGDILIQNINTKKLTETKQKKEKVIPITKAIREILESMKDNRRKEHGYIIPRKRNSNIRPDSTKILKEKIRKLSGINDFIFHDLRHTASTIMISEALGKGVGLADIMKILGHSKMETTLKYIHADFDRMKKAVEILENKTVK